jgi:hypothetical protein
LRCQNLEHAQTVCTRLSYNPKKLRLDSRANGWTAKMLRGGGGIVLCARSQSRIGIWYHTTCPPLIPSFGFLIVCFYTHKSSLWCDTTLSFFLSFFFGRGEVIGPGLSYAESAISCYYYEFLTTDLVSGGLHIRCLSHTNSVNRE